MYVQHISDDASAESDLNSYKIIREWLLSTHDGNRTAMQEVSTNTQGIFFQKVAHSSHDVSSEVFQTGIMINKRARVA
jgi:hypothetical protein